MVTVRINELQPAYIALAEKARRIAVTQGRPAYVAQGPHGQVSRDFPGVWCFRVHADGNVDCSVIHA